MCKPVARSSAGVSSAALPAGASAASPDMAKRKGKKDRPPGTPQWVCACWHAFIAASTLGVVVGGPAYWPSLPLLVWSFLYGDMYSAVLHCSLDQKECLSIPGIGGVAKGFQDHHDFPIASTQDKGLWVLCCDTVRIQWVTAGAALLFGRWNYRLCLLVLLKLLCCAYGTQVGHYYAHATPERVPAVVRTLQRWHVLLPPAHHWQHHKDPYESNFGIVSGLSAKLFGFNFFLRDCYRFGWVISLWAFLTFFDVALMERLNFR